MKKFPILAKLAALVWLVFGSVMAVTLLFVISKLEGREALVTLIALIMPIAFLFPAIKVLANKSKGLKLTSTLIFALSLGAIVTQQLPTDQFIVFIGLLCSSIIGFAGDSKYRAYIGSSEPNVIEEQHDEKRFQILVKGSSIVAVDLSNFIAPDDINDYLSDGYEMKEKFDADSIDDAIARYRNT